MPDLLGDEMDIEEYQKHNNDEIEIKNITIKNYDEINKFFGMRRPETSDSNITDLYLWKNCYPTWYYCTEKSLIWIARSENGTYYSTIPCCRNENLQEAFYETERFFNTVLDKKLTMYVVDKQAVDILDLPKDKYIVVRDRSYDDYIYDAEKLRTLSGRKYHKKKNHLNAFRRGYEGRYEFRMLNIDNKKEILEFLVKWTEMKEDTAQKEYIDFEAKGIEEIFDYQDVLQFKIGGVYIDGKLEAFSVGKYYSKEDMAYISVEKANPAIRGLYAYINSEFLVQAFPEASKVNREDDMGIEGLRKAKESYNPIYRIEKYTIIQK